MDRFDLLMRRQYPRDHVGRVEPTHIVNDLAGLERLLSEDVARKRSEIQPDGQGQAKQQQDDEQGDDTLIALLLGDRGRGRCAGHRHSPCLDDSGYSVTRTDAATARFGNNRRLSLANGLRLVRAVSLPGFTPTPPPPRNAHRACERFPRRRCSGHERRRMNCGDHAELAKPTDLGDDVLGDSVAEIACSLSPLIAAEGRWQ